MTTNRNTKRNATRAARWAMVADIKRERGCESGFCPIPAHAHALHPEALDFDHRVGVDKVGNVSDMIRSDYGHKAIMGEIAKCDVLCAWCHRVVTAQRKPTAT